MPCRPHADRPHADRPTGSQGRIAAPDRAGGPMTRPAPAPIQPLLWPEDGINTEQALFFRLSGKASHDRPANRLTFRKGGRASFDTAFNLFNLGKWRRCCALDAPGLRLQGSGTFILTVLHDTGSGPPRRLLHRTVTLAPDAVLDLPAPAGGAAGILTFTLAALGPATLSGADWTTTQPPRRLPRLALCITTYRREEALYATVERYRTFLRKTPLARHLHLIVVDNGQSVTLPPSDDLTLIPARNYGGSGGFARGLIEARRRGDSHCLFMDDDASVLMPAIERVWSFLAHATDPAAAVAGGLTYARRRWSMWENTAAFDRHCHPNWRGTDLRRYDDCRTMETATTARPPRNVYGGWWFFAFDITQATYRPFPFFVRGDDISFCLANAFDITTLPGVVCFPDADFADKESLRTQYLDLRNHLIHHLAVPHMDIGLRRTLSIPWLFFLPSLFQCFYETIAAQCLALDDVMRGPDFFARNADLRQRRADLDRMLRAEAWHPVTARPAAPRILIPAPKGDARPAWLWRWYLAIHLNGHLLPFFGLWGNRITLPAERRGHLPDIWGAARITWVTADGSRSFTTRHSKPKALKQLLRLTWRLARLALRYRSLKAEWQAAYPALASDDFWTDRFAPDAATGPAQDDRPAP